MINDKLITLGNLERFKQEEDALLAAKQDTLVSGTNIKTLNNESLLGSGNIDIQSAPLTEITYAALKALRDGGNLVPGMQYRITDFVTTCNSTRDPYTSVTATSAGHQFDLIVTAVDASHLAEECRACLHAGDTYFSQARLEAWQVWYCLDNDTSKFAWADSTNGKGVIYRLIDEFFNDAPFDFKNILSDSMYTFGTNYDASLMVSGQIQCAHNVIRAYISSLLSISSGAGRMMRLGGNRITSGYENTLSEGCTKCTIQGNYNFLETECQRININGSTNYFGFSCKDITFHGSSFRNVFLSGCYYITLGANSRGNWFGPECRDIYGGQYTCYCSFGAHCEFINFGTAYNVLSSYYQHIIFDNGCNYVNLICDDTSASSSNYVQNVHVHSGVCGNGRRVTINVPDRNLPYSIDYYKDGHLDVVLP